MCHRLMLVDFVVDTILVGNGRLDDEDIRAGRTSSTAMSFASCILFENSATKGSRCLTVSDAHVGVR